MAGARQVVLSYGTFDSNDTNVQLTGVHTLTQDERTFRCVYDVVIQASTAADVSTAASAMITALNERHQDFSITVGGTKFYHFVDGVDGTPAADEEGAEFIQATWALLGTHRSLLSRAYRITVTVTRAAQQPNKFGVLDQNISLGTNSIGQRTLRFRATFTPGPSSSESGTAKDRHDDGTYGYDALASGVLAVLGGTWERTGTKFEGYEEDQRVYTGSASYTELIYDQSASGRNDSALVNVQYDIRVERPSARGIPEFLAVKPFTGVAVNFSSGVATTYSGTLEDAITEKVLPYVEATVSRELLPGETPVLLGHGLRADPISNRIAGQVLFLVSGPTVLEVRKSINDEVSSGDLYAPVLDGTRWTRDKHTGPGLWVRSVTYTARVVGSNPDVPLKLLEENVIKEQQQIGFELVDWTVASSPNVETFDWSSSLETEIRTVVQRRTLVFIRQNPRGQTPGDPAVGNDLNGHGDRTTANG